MYTSPPSIQIPEIGNGQPFSSQAGINKDFQPNYMYQWPVPKVKGVCTLKLKFHLMNEDELDTINFGLIENYLNLAFNSRDIYFEYNYNYIPSMNQLYNSPGISLKSALSSPPVTSVVDPNFLNIVMFPPGSLCLNAGLPGAPCLTPNAEVANLVEKYPNIVGGLNYFYPNASSNFDENQINARQIAYTLGLMLGLFPAQGINSGQNNSQQFTITSSEKVYFSLDDVEKGDFIFDTPPIGSNFDVAIGDPANPFIDWNSCLSLPNGNSLPSPIKNIMAPVHWFRTCVNEFTVEQGRKIRFNVVNSPELFNCLTSSSSMTWLGYMNTNANTNISSNTIWQYPAIVQQINIEDNVLFESSSLVEMVPLMGWREPIINPLNGGVEVKFINYYFDVMKITVKKGAEFQLNGGELDGYKPFKLKWNKIELIGASNEPQGTNQPRAIFNNATVRNGREVVFPAKTFSSENSINWSTTGGYVQASNTVFENNRRVVGFLPYQNMNQGILQNNISFFENCVFKLDEDYNFSNDPAQITAWGVDMIPVLGCSFLNETATPPNGYAIQTAQTSFFVEPTATKPSIIKGFEYGIKSEMLNHVFQTISVTNTIFEDNYFGAYFKNIDFHVFEANQIFVPNRFPLFRNYRYPTLSAPYGYYNFGGTAFVVRHNSFEQMNGTNTSPIKPIGLVVNNSGPDLNFISNNSFSNLDIGFEGIGHNRDYVGQDPPSEKGLQLLCNNFNFGKVDIYIPDVLQAVPMGWPNIKSDIASFQGNNMEPAYNLFSHATNTSIDFGNHGGLIEYFHPSPQMEPRVEPRNAFSFGVVTNNLEGDFNPNFCASIDVEGFQWGTFSNAVTDYQNLVNLYTTILDQGSTSDLLNEIYLSPSSEYFELYSNLMAEPGVLSEEVVMELVHNPDFPNILIRNIVIANPHLIQSDAFWTELENRSPTFTATMLDEMWSGLANTSPIQLLLAQMGSAQQKVLAIGANGLREIGSNPATWQNNLDTVQMICNALSNPYFKFLTLLHEKTFNENLALEDSILVFLQTPAISDMEIQYFDEITTLYKHYYNVKASPEGMAAGLAGISQEVIAIMENSPYLTMRSLASSMLLKEHDDNLPNVNSATSSISHFDIVLPISGSSNKKGQRSIPSAVVAANSLRVYPNPASEVVNLEVIWTQPVGEVDIQVQSIEGRVVLQHTHATSSIITNLPVSIKSLAKGTYVISATSNTGEIVKQKLVVQ